MFSTKQYRGDDFTPCDHFSDPLDRERVISGGCTGLVEALPCGHVRKILYPEDQQDSEKLQDLVTEAEVYRRIASRRHPNLLQLVEFIPKRGIVLPHVRGMSLRAYLGAYPQTPTAQRLAWAAEAASALHCLHDCGVIHSDLNPTNLLVDQATDALYLIDFSGSTVDGVVGSGMEGHRFYLPGIATPCVRSDLFAFGSTMYELMTGSHPYPDLDGDEVEGRFSKGQFPDTSMLAGGSIIKDCWEQQYATAKEVESDLRIMYRRLLAAPQIAFRVIGRIWRGMLASIQRLRGFWRGLLLHLQAE
ncbi:hypothetical protein DOTSEDRAFT_83933 [Dothistroma septosporum NZE10]|uniref:Protein kinase domain-containing protein n=1 Tax=Dothistroma septosporum (strain NZE10 / CBS 128990) TaxID=675120 RepID=M2YHQ0_DOTSN|nr:hypothetical protein DOTSEDRAFT_83933 [Dothistroma septosporum NZE10]